MPIIDHMNVANADNQVYCCLRNKIVVADHTHKNQFCMGCKMYQGDLQGKGIACSWEDSRVLDNPYQVSDPYGEWLANQKRKVQLTMILQTDTNSDSMYAG